MTTLTTVQLKAFLKAEGIKCNNLNKSDLVAAVKEALDEFYGIDP